MVYGPPDSKEIGGIDDLKDGEQTKVTCTAKNGYPAPLIHWYMESTNFTKNSSLGATENYNGRINAQSTLVFTPSRYNHGKHLICQVLQPTAPSLKSQNDTKVLNVLYSPIITNFSVRRLQDDRKLVKVQFECTSDANPPALNFSWFHNDTMISNNTGISIYPVEIYSGTISTSILVIHSPQPSHAGKYECKVTTDLGNASASLIYSSIPDPPSQFIVDRNKTTSSTLFGAWQPGFDGGLPQTFSLEYCLSDTQGQDNGCDVVTNLTGTTHNLTGLKPFTWYRLTLWAENAAGNSSSVAAEASTAPLPPESYGINITWERASKVLTFSKENQSFTGLCLVVQNTSLRESCSSVTEAECVEPGSKDTFDSKRDPVVLTFGRGLCSKPASLSVVEAPSHSGRSQPFMPIALGVSASAGVILLVSVGLMHFYGLLCFVKRKKARSKASSKTRTTQRGETSKSTSQQVSQDAYAELEPRQEGTYEPLRSTKSSTSFYMDMKPIASTHSTTLGCKQSGSGSSNDEYVSPSFTGKEQEPMYASADDPSYINTVSKVTKDRNDVPNTYSEIKPNMPPKPCSGGFNSCGFDKREYSPYLKLRENDRLVDKFKAMEAVYANTESKASQEEFDDAQYYTNNLPIATKDEADVTTECMGMKPLSSTISQCHHILPFNSKNLDYSPSTQNVNDTGDKRQVLYANTEEMTFQM